MTEIRIMPPWMALLMPRVNAICLYPAGIWYKHTPSIQTISHERIHWIQQREMLCLFFYLWYLIEWLIKLLPYGRDAYWNISFEREAYDHEDLPDGRQPYGWLRYIIHQRPRIRLTPPALRRLTREVRISLRESGTHVPLHQITAEGLMALRMEKKLSLREVSQMTGISSSTVSRIEKGRECKLSSINRLIEFYTSIRATEPELPLSTTKPAPDATQ